MQHPLADFPISIRTLDSLPPAGDGGEGENDVPPLPKAVDFITVTIFLWGSSPEFFTGVNMQYSIRKARQEDLPEIRSLYAGARAFMRKAGNPDQWGTGYPPEAVVQEEVEQENLYLLCDQEKIHGVFMFRIFEDPTYQIIEEGDWHFREPYGVIHRVAGDGSGGILQAAVAFAEEQVSYLRMDTHENNHPMQGALLKQGFTYCGIIYLQNSSPRWAYDRLK